MNSEKAKRIIQAFLNDPRYETSYKALKNVKGSSIGVQRRRLITGVNNKDYSAFGYLKMEELLFVEKHLNERWGLCPYGLEPQQEVKEGKEAMVINRPVLDLSGARDLLNLDPAFMKAFNDHPDDSSKEKRDLIKDHLNRLGYDGLRVKERELLEAFFNGEGNDDDFTNANSSANSKEVDMTAVANAPLVEKVINIRGQDSRSYSDDQIFHIIRDMENQIKGLQQLEAKSKKLEAKIKALQDGIQELVEVVDSRD